MIEEEGFEAEQALKKRKVVAEDNQIETNKEGDLIDIEFMTKLNESYDTTSFIENPFISDNELQTSQYTIVRGHKRFEYHTPGKSKLDTVGNRDLSRLFDIRLFTNDHPNCCQETEKIYQAYRKAQNNNIHITEISGAVEISKKALKLWGMDCPEGNFNHFMLYILTDYYQNCQHSNSYDYSDERTFFCETIIPLFKSFSVMMGEMCGIWCEKQLTDLKIMWIPLKDYRASGVNKKLLHGIIINNSKTSVVLIESSGSDDKLERSIDDAYKQMKSSSDFLKSLMCKYKLVIVDTAKQVYIPAISIGIVN